MAADDRVQAAALRYAELGWPVFPLRAGDKRPANRDGFLGATTDPEAIQRMFPAGTKYNLAAAIPAELIALDTDPEDENGPSGDEALAALDFGTPTTSCQRTPRGGWHRIYRLPHGVRGFQTQSTRRDRKVTWEIGSHVETRAHGKGYIAVEPSVVGGKRYKWEVPLHPDKIADAPAWLVEWCKGKAAAEANGNAHGAPEQSGATWALPESIPVGLRNGTVFKFAAHWRACGYAEDLAYLGMLHLHQVCEQPPSDPFPLTEAEKAFRSAWERYPAGPTPAELHPPESGSGSAAPPASERPTVSAIDFADLVAVELPARDLLLEPFLFAKSLGEHYAARGVGKTHVSLGIAYAVSTGGEFLRWRAPRPARVLLVDGEMVAGGQGGLQERLRGLAAGGRVPEPGMLRIVSYDLQGDGGIPSLATVAGQAAIEQHLDGVELLILDNLSCLFDLPENDADEWKAKAQPWLMSLRRRGISVLFAHHAGKSGQQRGTGAREDVLDYVIRLRHPPGYDHSEGARFIVGFEKVRGVPGRALAAFEARLQADQDGVPRWSCTDSIAIRKALVEDLLSSGLSVSAVARELGENKGTVSKWKRQLGERER